MCIFSTRLRPIAVSLLFGAALLLSIFSASMSQAQMSPRSVNGMEVRLENEFETYFGRDLATVERDVEGIAEILRDRGQKTNTNPAVLWAIPRADHLHLVLLTGDGQLMIRDLFDVPEDLLRQTTRRFFSEVSRPRRSSLEAAQQLHRWIIEPLEADHLKPQGIDSLLICLGNGLRGLPIAALYDGDRFLIEDYNLTRIPAFNLIDTTYDRLSEPKLLTMGASEFDDLAALPAVPFELNNIRDAFTTERTVRDHSETRMIKIAPKPSLLNGDFTVDQLRAQLDDERFNVIHLATHALFNPGDPEESFIKFWEASLPLSRMNDLPWNRPALDLLVLSACQTAIGDDEAELGFAGVALQAGVKTVIASLWSISDLGTAALMSELYRHLGQATTKAEALRRAQLAVLRGEVRIEAGELVLSDDRIPLPPEFIADGVVDSSASIAFQLPFFWSGLTTIGNPW